jgi:alkylation response protein AidB-like acyl-CoA dehydrogenase
MRAIGMSERALESMARRALCTAFGATLAAQGVVRRDIAESRITIEQLRLLVHKTAWLLDTVGHKGARIEVAAIKAAVPRAAAEIIDRAIQVHGGLGLSGDVLLAQLYAASRAPDRRRSRRCPPRVGGAARARPARAGLNIQGGSWRYSARATVMPAPAASITVLRASPSRPDLMPACRAAMGPVV